MPPSKKVTWAKLRVGAMAAVAMLLLFVLVFLITGSRDLFAEEAVVYTYMGDAAAMTRGSPVRLNGILVGEVKDVELSGSNVPERVVRMVLELEKKYLTSIPEDSVAAVSAENVLGTKYINIKKGLSSRTVPEGGEIRALNVQGFEEVVQQGYTLLASLQGLLKRIDSIVSLIEVGKGSIGKLLVSEELYNRLNASVGEIQKLSQTLTSGKGTVGKLIYDESLYNDIRGTISKVDAMMLEIQEGKGTTGRLIKDPALYEETQKTIAELRTMLQDLNAGKGTAGKLLKSDELHKQIAGTLLTLDGMMERLNSGQGTVGQLLVNPQLYDSLNGVTRDMGELLREFRANPSKFMRVRVTLF